MFKELVNQISAANVNLKAQNYTGKTEGSFKKKAKTVRPPVDQNKDVVRVKDDLIDIRSAVSEDDFDRQFNMS